MARISIRQAMCSQEENNEFPTRETVSFGGENYELGFLT